MAVNGNVNGNSHGSGDPTALQFANPRLADEVIQQSLHVPEDLRGQVMVVPFQGLVDWARKNSLWPVTFGLACCAIEYMGVQNSRFDLSRFGMEINRASPRADPTPSSSSRTKAGWRPSVLRTCSSLSATTCTR